MKLIAFATHNEARSTISALSASITTSDSMYRYEHGYILITGIGAVNAAVAVSRHLRDVSSVHNYGICGVLNGTHVGAIHTIATVAKFVAMPDSIDQHSQMFSEAAHPLIHIANNGLRLVTSDFPIHNSEIRDKLACSADLVDMEGYGIAVACKQAGIPCHMVKVVSDFASQGGQHQIKQQLAQLSEQIAQLVLCYA